MLIVIAIVAVVWVAIVAVAICLVQVTPQDIENAIQRGKTDEDRHQHNP